jgi:hypothetical protein
MPMGLESWRVLQHVHGHLGWLAAAALVHPAFLLRDPARRADRAVGASALLVTAAAALGAWLYVGYREHLKRSIFVESPAMGLLFERKEHLAFGAVMLAWAGSAAYVGARRAAGATREHLRALAFRAFASAAALAVLVAVLGTLVAVFRGFD